MALFGRFRQREDEVPEDIRIDALPGCLYAPVSGEATALADFPDPVFSTGSMGEGIVIEPGEGVLYAPCDGEVTVTTVTRHAIGLTDRSGAHVLLHVGIDTVALRGEGFEYFAEKGDHVRAGQVLMAFDRSIIKGAGLDDHVVMVVTNAEDFAAVRPVEPGRLDAGDLAVTVVW